MNQDLVNLKTFAERQGKGMTWCSAAKKAAGITGRYFSPDVLVKWLKANPDFKIQQVYSRTVAEPGLAPSSSRPGRPSVTVCKSDAHS